ncbi:hypothetical protein [Metabacillus lacus]|nr:hypothetical protein [Metabacillus lacus]
MGPASYCPSGFGYYGLSVAGYWYALFIVLFVLLLIFGGSYWFYCCR